MVQHFQPGTLYVFLPDGVFLHYDHGLGFDAMRIQSIKSIMCGRRRGRREGNQPWSKQPTSFKPDDPVPCQYKCNTLLLINTFTGNRSQRFLKKCFFWISTPALFFRRASKIISGGCSSRVLKLRDDSIRGPHAKKIGFKRVCEEQSVNFRSLTERNFRSRFIFSFKPTKSHKFKSRQYRYK